MILESFILSFVNFFLIIVGLLSKCLVSLVYKTNNRYNSSEESLKQSINTTHDIILQSKNGIKIKTVNDDSEYSYQNLQDRVQTVSLTRDAEKEKKENLDRYVKFMEVKNKLDAAVFINSARIQYFKQGGRNPLKFNKINNEV